MGLMVKEIYTVYRTAAFVHLAGVNGECDFLQVCSSYLMIGVDKARVGTRDNQKGKE